MERLDQSCSEYICYPKNLICHKSLKHNLIAYSERLHANARRMFVNDGSAALDFLDLSHGDEAGMGFQPSQRRNLNDLILQLREAHKVGSSEPQCRFIFIHARHSRDPLNISFKMFCFLLSYLQVMPSFLDYAFPFGDQEQAQDFYFSGLKEDNTLEMSCKGLEIPQLRRSGLEMRLCYNLRSVEGVAHQKDLPWSIRQMAVYTSFDFVNGKSVCMTIKGNTLIKDRLSELAHSWQVSQFGSLPEAFRANLGIHLLICDWSLENWRWYINDLESALQNLTRDALSIIVDRPHTPVEMSPTASFPAPMSPQSRTGTSATTSKQPQEMSPIGRSKTFFSMSSTPTLAHTTVSQTNITAIKDDTKPERSIRARMGTAFNSAPSILGYISSANAWSNWSRRNPSSVPLSEMTPPLDITQNSRQEPDVLPPDLSQMTESNFRDAFRFRDLQRNQHLAEKTQEVLLVLRLNMEVLHDLVQHFDDITSHQDFPSVISDSCALDIARFRKCVRGVEKDLKIQHSRTETLLQLLADRKKFLHGLLQFRSMQESERFTKKAQRSADEMESVTKKMHEIAQKTKQETVSMRIITLVTLFFLPGTFIGTFMSTDIIQFEKDNKQYFQPKGLKLYLQICIPLMLVTFLAWYAVYKSVNRDANKKTNSERDHLDMV